MLTRSSSNAGRLQSISRGGLHSGHDANDKENVSVDVNVDALRKPQVAPSRIPSKPPANPFDRASRANSLVTAHSSGLARQRGVPPTMSADVQLEPIAGVVKVDSDSDVSDSEHHGAVHVPRSDRLGQLSKQSSFRRSAAVSRQASDASVSSAAAAGAAFQLLRGVVSPQTHQLAELMPLPTGSRRTSRSNSLIGAAHYSRVSSASRRSLTSTPEVMPLQPPSAPLLKSHLMHQAQQSLEEEISRRHSRFAPENVQLRRWLTVLAVARSAAALVCAGGLRVRTFNLQQRALATLTELLVPVWRLHRIRRRRIARDIIQRFILRAVLRRRIRQRRQATDTITHFLKNKLGMFQHYARWFSRCVRTIQRAFRNFRRRRDAMVELNLRNARKLEGTYWAQARLMMSTRCGSVPKRATLKSSNGNASRASSPVGLHADPFASKPPGLMPDSILRKNLRPLIFKKCREYLHETQRRTQQAVEHFKHLRRNSLSAMMKCPELSKRAVVIRLPPFRAFLTQEDIFSAFDDSAITVAALRDEPQFAAHLEFGGKTPVPTLETSHRSESSGELSLRSDRFFQNYHFGESSSDMRTCSFADLFAGSRTKPQ